VACSEGCCDLVAALVGAVAKTSPSDQVQFQFFHETAPEKEDSLVPIKQQECKAIM